MVNAKLAVHNAAKALADAKIDEALHEARLLFKFVTKKDIRLLCAASEITDDEAKQFSELCKKRASRYPLQYILGAWPFMDFELFVGDGVLIPRSDTETVCIAAAEKCAAFEKPRVVDLCAGSGAIALGVKSLVPHADITAVELHDSAFKYLEHNSNGKIQCVKYDVLKYNEIMPFTTDIIVCNPPYITKAEMTALQPELFFEPRNALTDEGDGLSFYRHIARAYKPLISPNGWLIFETGFAQTKDVEKICKDFGWKHTKQLLDLSGNPRAVLSCNI